MHWQIMLLHFHHGKCGILKQDPQMDETIPYKESSILVLEQRFKQTET